MNEISEDFWATAFREEKKFKIRELTLKHGLSYPNNEELIMLILGSGTKKLPINELAKQVLQIIMSSNDENLLRNLLKIKGIGYSKALIIAAALEFGKRINRTPDVFLETPTSVIPFIQNYAVQKTEHFLCVTLNGAAEIISIRVLCIGSKNMAIIQPAEVFEEAIKEHASSIIIAHNHPSGNSYPSVGDIKITIRLYTAAEILGINLLDHIILSKTDYFSFSEHGTLNPKGLMGLLPDSEKEKTLRTASMMVADIDDKTSILKC